MSHLDFLMPLLTLALFAARCFSITYYYKANEPEDFLIGALFPVHRPPYTRQNVTRLCGETWERPGIQRVEAALQAIDEINSRDDLLPNSTLGIQIRDSCWFSPIALEQASHYIPLSAWTGAEYQEEPYPYQRRSSEECEEEESRKNLVAVLGPLAAAGASEVNSLLSLFRIPEIGYSTMGQELGLRSRLGFYVSLVPMEQAQARAMVDLVRYFNWTYLSVVYTEGDSSSQSSLEEFAERAVRQNVCVSQWLGVPASGTAEDYLTAVRNLNRTSRARVVVCFCTSVTVQGLLAGIRAANATGDFNIVASDAWTTDAKLLAGLEAEALGTLALRVHVKPDPDFEVYYTQLNPDENTRNPWFAEFWETYFNCSLEDRPDCTQNCRPRCTGNESLADNFHQDEMVSGVKSAVYMVAYALHDMLQDYCGQGARLPGDNCTRQVHVSGDRFVEYLRNVSGVHRGDAVEMYANACYDIVNFQALEDGQYEFVDVAIWSDEERIFMHGEPRWSDKDEHDDEVPVSQCGKPCPRGYIKVPESNTNLCCWKCVQCGSNQYVYSEYRCGNCESGTWPNATLNGCDPIPQKYLQWTESAVVVVMVVSALALATAACVSAVYVRYINTPLIKASSCELSFVILVGIIVSQASTFAILAKPSPTSCLMERLFPVLSVAAVHAAIFTKTNRIARILAVSERRIFQRRLRFMSTAAQLTTTGILIMGQVVITGTMLVVQRPGTVLFYPASNRAVLLCNTTELASFLPLAYDFVLIAMCTVYAVKTRNVPENFNEAKMIGFAMYSTVVIWVAYIAVYIGNEDNRELALCLAISISSLSVLVLLFLPRVYIVLFRPEKNRRSSFLTFRQDTMEAKVNTVSGTVAHENGGADLPRSHDSVS
ncbi:metabotropic glutamate receptor 1-like isoform X1 [Dermacentor albipictus]|uniref:metabotropic glutamate receptor 1-like isoform X1 n=1 Tax=Dermacentor albipictus TaxID=60249 RepID=UPI0031FCDE9F